MKKSRFEELADIWFEKASEDVLWAKNSFQGGFWGNTCFVCQQVAEKSLKAYLFHQRERLIRTHNLEKLLERCLVYDKEFLEIKENCKVLNRYYTDTRYPDIWDYSRFQDEKIAREALLQAEEILEFVSKKLQANLTR